MQEELLMLGTRTRGKRRLPPGCSWQDWLDGDVGLPVSMGEDHISGWERAEDDGRDNVRDEAVSEWESVGGYCRFTWMHRVSKRDYYARGIHKFIS
jgi:hypothetical protein